MFRIKTDIRQYRCRSPEKVERLIRNWIIRPADLIYDQEHDQWSPIGEHPSFIELFKSIAEADEGLEETVITPRAANSAARDRAQTRRAADTPPQSATSARPKAAILRRPRRAQRGASTIKSAPQPPIPSPEVEGVIRDSDEITMMTDRTLDLLGADMLLPEQEPVEQASTSADEKTQLIERPIFDDDADEQPPLGRHGLPEDVFATAEIPGPDDDGEERLDELAELEDAATAPTDDTVVTPHPAPPSQPDTLATQNGPPQEELPEDEDEAAQEVIIELVDTVEPDEEHEVAPALDETILLVEQVDEQEETLERTLKPSDLDETIDLRTEVEPDDDVSDDLDETVELSAESIVDDEELGPRMEKLDDELLEEEEAEEERKEPARQGELDDIEEGISQEELVIDSDALDEAMDELEDAATAAQEERADESADFFTDAGLPPQPRLDMTAEAYKMELPFVILPSEEALKIGITPTELSERQRDAFFSRPSPKDSHAFVTVRYDLSNEVTSDPTFNPKIAAAIGAAALLILILILVFL